MPTVVPAHTGTHIPEAAVMGPRFRGDDIYESSTLGAGAYSGSSAGGCPNAGSGRPAIAQAARTVLASRHAMVIGPTPPGTGEIEPATSATSANATSPTMRERPPAGVTRLTPTSMTVAPGLTQSRRTISGRPTAANKRSARRQTA